MDKNEREFKAARLHIELLRKTMKDLRNVQSAVKNFISEAPLREIYRGLRSSKAHKSATDILVHTENVTREINELERSLRDGEVILIQQAQYYERKQKDSR